MPKLAVTTWYDDAFAPLGDLCLASLAGYCRRHPYDLVIPEVPRADRPAAWHKIEILRHLLNEFPFVFWVDADAMIVDPEPAIDECLQDGKDVFLANHRIGGEDIPNTGVLLLRRSEWTGSLLDEIWRNERWLNHPWWDNAALLDLLGYRAPLGDGRPTEPRRDLLERIGWLDPRWNELPGELETSAPIIRHYAGRSFDRRYAEMSRDLRRLRRRSGADFGRLSIRGWAWRLRTSLPF